MSYQVSTGLRDHLLITGSLKSALDGGVIKIYSGPVPASADSAIDPSSVLLTTVSDNGTGSGLTLDTVASSGVVLKSTTQVWKGTNVADGTATFFRFCPTSDTGSASTTIKRVQGTVGVLNATLLLASTTLVTGNEQRIDSAAFGMPSA